MEDEDIDNVMCPCGHTRAYHSADNDPLLGHYCTVGGCECIDFIPVDTDDEDEE